MTNEEALNNIKLDMDITEAVGLDSVAFKDKILYEAYKVAIEALEKVEVLELLLDWAIECDFGLDSLGEDYELYKEQLTDDMTYKEMMIKIAQCYLEDKRSDEDDE